MARLSGFTEQLSRFCDAVSAMYRLTGAMYCSSAALLSIPLPTRPPSCHHSTHASYDIPGCPSMLPLTSFRPAPAPSSLSTSFSAYAPPSTPLCASTSPEPTTTRRPTPTADAVTSHSSQGTRCCLPPPTWPCLLDSPRNWRPSGWVPC